MAKRGKRRGADRLPKSSAGGKVARRDLVKVAKMLNNVHELVDAAPEEMKFPRESIQELLVAACYLMHIKRGVYTKDDYDEIKFVIRALERALGPLGLGVDYWDPTRMNQLQGDLEAGENSI